MKNKSENLESQKNTNEISEQQETQVAGGKKVRILLDGEPHDMEFLEGDFNPKNNSTVPPTEWKPEMGAINMRDVLRRQQEQFDAIEEEVKLLEKLYPERLQPYKHKKKG